MRSASTRGCSSIRRNCGSDGTGADEPAPVTHRLKERRMALLDGRIAMRALLLASTLLAGMAVFADVAEARSRGIQRPLPPLGAAFTTVRPPQAAIMRPAEFVIVRTPHRSSVR